MEINVTDEFRDWYEPLTENEQEAIFRVVALLEENGISLGHPYSSAIKTAKVIAMRELRIQHLGNAIRILYAFDPQRDAVLLIGGTKRSQNWYETAVPKAEKLFLNYLRELRRRK